MLTGLQTLALYEASAPAVIDEIAHGRPAQIRALVSRGMLATRLIEVTLDLDRDAVHFLATVERWPAGDKKSRIAGFDLPRPARAAPRKATRCRTQPSCGSAQSIKPDVLDDEDGAAWSGSSARSWRGFTTT
ncbi:MAG TPA: hypothetical protein PKA64_11125, partial [Myxococcota bacterium]|nr:hypothetical protein [Myxococcota bacterium]